MSRVSGKTSQARRIANANSLAAFGVDATQPVNLRYEDVRIGNGPTLFTVGYERRDGEDLINALRDAGVDFLLDVRDRPFSRKPDFREKALAAACSDAGIRYESWTRLGSTDHQREQLRDSGDFSEFRRRFRDLAKRGRTDEIFALAELTKKHSIALICYERCHGECHRSIIAELVAEINDASITAIR